MPGILIQSDPKAREKPCLRCGYSLRKILDARFCPECGLSVWLSLNPDDSIDRSRPSWSMRLALASWIMAIALLLVLATFMIGWWRYAPFSRIVRAGAQPIARRAFASLGSIQQLQHILAGISLMLYNVGLLALAGYEGRHPDKWQGHRVACRIGAIIGLLVAVYVLMERGHAGKLYALSLCMSCVVTLIYLHALAKRIPNSTLARLSLMMLIGPALSVFSRAPIGLMDWLIARVDLTRFMQYAPWAYLPATAALLIWFAIIIQSASNRAKRTWAAETAPNADAGIVD